MGPILYPTFRFGVICAYFTNHIAVSAFSLPKQLGTYLSIGLKNSPFSPDYGDMFIFAYGRWNHEKIAFLSQSHKCVPFL